MWEGNKSVGHPIRVVMQRTGLTAATLRAWERRYQVVVPTRSDGGHRLYSDADVHRLRTMVRALDGGRTISQVARLGHDELEALIREDRQERAPVVTVHAAQSGQAQLALEFIEGMRSAELERLLMRATVSHRPAELVSGLLIPILHSVGLAWQSGQMGASSEHLASNTIRRYLDWLMRTVQADAGGPLVVTGTPSGQRHEFGALLAGVVAAGEGWTVHFLGPDLPTFEIVRAATTLGASVVALSAVHPTLPEEIVTEVARMPVSLSAEVDVVIGGNGATPYRPRWDSAGVRYFDDLDQFREGLGAMRPSDEIAAMRSQQ